MKRVKPTAGAVPLVEPITVTKFTARYPLTKTLTLAENGKIESCFKGLGRGVISRLHVTAKQLLNELISIGPNDCWCFGQPIDDRADNVISKPEFEAATPPKGTITRTREQFGWPAGPAILMVDYDPGRSQLSQKQLLAILYDVCPALRDASHIWAASASSFIENVKTGLDIHGLRGQRVYIAVANGTDIDRAAAVLIKLLWLAGHGHIAISSSGQMLTRCVIDTTVFQPTRIDFCAPAICQAPLKQQKPAPVLLGNELLCLDSEVALPNLTQTQVVQYEQLVRDEKARMQGEADAVREATGKERVEKLVSRGIAQDVAESTVRAALDTQTLYADFPLTTSDGINLTVGDLLANKKKYDGILLHDPLEPDYRDDNRIAKALLSGRRPVIHSFAHGECIYELRDARQAVLLVPGHRAAYVSEITNFFKKRGMFFQFGGELVAIEANGLTSVQDQWTMQAELDRCFLFQHSRATGLVNVDATEVLARLIVRGHRREFEKVLRVVTAPAIVATSGRLISEPGYDVETKLFVDLSTPYPPIPEKPSKQEIECALELLATLLEGFNFVAPIDVSTFLAALLTAVARPLLESAPGFGFSAPTQGSGKSTLMRIVMALGGSSKAMSGQPDNDEEMRKRILTILMENSGAIVIDNIVGTFDSKTLASVMTTPFFKDRVLGVTRNAEVSTAAIVLLSGNNLTIKGDLLRRLLVVRIDTGMERPYERSFAIDPVRVVTARRPEFVVAAMTLIKAYKSRPDRARPCDGSSGFDEWDMVVREPICWLAEMIRSKQIKAPIVFAALVDPRRALGNAAAVDPYLANHGILLRAWAAALGTGDTSGTRFTVKSAVDQLHPNKRIHSSNRTELDALHAALLVVASSRVNPSDIDTGKLGSYLSGQQGKIVDGFRFLAGPIKQHVVEWFVENVNEDREAGEVQDIQKKTAEVISITNPGKNSLTSLTGLAGNASRTKPEAAAALRRKPSSVTVTIKARKK